ncbi:hypothetical protein Javan290_0041 [Streptococcus phage Javan290]|uniref:YopX family protein n=1 Tax=Streptococcus marmotae TaxID=1825069 RepID=UPI0008368393|nr:YopX family protein [Streptococcus marmotae]QBX26095.1 hypothetical protein Javan290_0041 [Streptococcus phage Javan290]
MIPKFRAWSKVDLENPEMKVVEGINYHGEGVWFNEIIDDETSADWADFNEIILMQSTGLFDKNGVEIFEGDIVLQNEWRKVVVSFGTQEVEENFGDIRIFQGFNLNLGGGYPTAVKNDFEVLGNIYENPELLEVE